VLFLERESYEVAKRAYHWLAALVALMASFWAFAWQLALAKRGSGQGLPSGLFVVALAAGMVYATKDRMKEIGRDWLKHRVHRVYGAQRITKYRAPSRRIPARDIVASARESFEQTLERVPDTLNPDSGATTPFTTLSYRHKGAVFPAPQLRSAGVRRIKHVFRYDLSPIFARLDDALKPVPVLDHESRSVKFVDAPRCYRVPVQIRVRAGGVECEDVSTLVIHKRGLDRLERATHSDDSQGDLGIEP
jgi:hypothetical protein